MSRKDRNANISKTKLLSFYGIELPKYDAWLAYLFDRPVTKNGWYFDWIEEPPEFDATSSDIVGLIGTTLANAGTDLATYSDQQIYHGLNYVFSDACSNMARVVADGSITIERRTAAVGAIKHLYKDCLEPRCSPHLGHLNEGSVTSLNGFAYMVWDTTDLWHMTRHIEDLNASILDVLDFVLYSPNEACIESALHGLGHEVRHCPSAIHAIIDRWLAGTRDADENPIHARGQSTLRPVRRELRAYAKAARRGMIL